MLKQISVAVALFLFAQGVLASSYIAVSKYESTYENDEFDRKYVGDVTETTVVKFSQKSDLLGELTGGVSLDGDNKVINSLLSFELKGKIFRVETQTQEGQIVSTSSDNEGFVYDEFTSDFFALSVADYMPQHDGATMGFTYVKMTLPLQYTISDGESNIATGEYVQDTETEVQMLGFGVFYDPMHKFMVSGNSGHKLDWYFYNETIVGVGLQTLSDDEALEPYDAQGKQGLTMASHGRWELGVFYGFKSHYISALLHAGYRLSANWGQNPLNLFITEEEGELVMDGFSRYTHGPGAGVSILF